MRSDAEYRDMKKKYGFRHSKSLGQNFLKDKNIIAGIISGSNIGPEDLVIEIGPGAGVLTRPAAAAAKKVLAVEIDRRLIPILTDTVNGYENVEIINADILKTDLNALIEKAGEVGTYENVRIIGNLPYYITTPIIMKILEDSVCAKSITAMMQKEVADRIESLPGNRTYGAISAAVRYYCTVERICTVPREAFVPEPKVDSAVIRLDIREEKPFSVLDEKAFFRCIRAAFGQRRKTLLNSLNGAFGTDKDSLRRILQNADIAPHRRAETLDIDDFTRLTDEMIKAGEM